MLTGFQDESRELVQREAARLSESSIVLSASDQRRGSSHYSWDRLELPSTSSSNTATSSSRRLSAKKQSFISSKLTITIIEGPKSPSLAIFGISAESSGKQQFQDPHFIPKSPSSPTKPKSIMMLSGAASDTMRCSNATTTKTSTTTKIVTTNTDTMSFVQSSESDGELSGPSSSRYAWDPSEFSASQRRRSQHNQPVMTPLSTSSGKRSTLTRSGTELGSKVQSKESLFDEEGVSLHPVRKMD
ncbi:hypothetical protein BC830DRAFT_686637 [Chytriomyces sp. MP71]|nr:hypothetical protein BC830DRAFT_686637 [Chytriomyces sp. MP71]